MRFTIVLVLALLPSSFIEVPAQIPAQTPNPPAITVPTAPASSPSTTTPSDSNVLAHPDRNQACAVRVAAAKAHSKPVDLIFIGDSITEGWNSPPWGGEDRGPAVWDKFYAPRNALNFGVGSDQTQNVLWRLDHMDVQDLKPKVAVLLIGTNNTHNTAPEIAAGVKAILDRTRQLYPGVKIILVSIMPNRRAGALTDSVNTLIRPYADDRTIYYLDLVPAMPPVGDNWKGLGNDHLHPNVSGYQIWAQAMEPLLVKLLSAP